MKVWISRVLNLRNVTLLLAVSVFFLLMCRGDIRHTDTPLPALPISTLAGAPISAESFADRPWVVNVWMPG